LPASDADYEDVSILRGPNIKPLPQAEPLTDSMELPCLLKVGDNITTDHIMPAGSKILPYRSNIPYLANFCFEVCDKEFPARALAANGGFILGGANYGQGSSREHAALVPLYLGIRAVLVKSFARIHKANLVNAGILPLTFVNAADYDEISLGDTLVLSGIFDGIASGRIVLQNKTTNKTYALACEISARQSEIIKAGGLLNYTRAAQ
ncbi:MAG: aconitate hydratase, partial [Ruthenibacterium sp.]